MKTLIRIFGKKYFEEYAGGEAPLWFWKEKFRKEGIVAEIDSSKNSPSDSADREEAMKLLRISFKPLIK